MRAQINVPISKQRWQPESNSKMNSNPNEGDDLNCKELLYKVIFRQTSAAAYLILQRRRDKRDEADVEDKMFDSGMQRRSLPLPVPIFILFSALFQS
jgi:hypothetical protein